MAVEAVPGAPPVPPGEHLRLRVADTGVGMARETLRHIFEPFFTTKERGKGTGMGLASVCGTAQAHGGAVTAESEPGRGTTVTLLLPLAGGAAPATRRAPAEPVRVTGRVLVVDDEPEVRELLFETLRELGYEVTACGDGAEGVERFREAPGRFDLVVLDLVMPRLGGREAFEALQALDPWVRVLVCSGYSAEGEAHALLRRGAVGSSRSPSRPPSYPARWPRPSRPRAARLRRVLPGRSRRGWFLLWARGRFETTQA